MSDNQDKPAPRGVVSWILGIAFLFLGFFSLIGSKLAALAFMAIAAFILPPARYQLARIRVNPSRLWRGALVALLFIIGFVAIVNAAPGISPRVKYEPKQEEVSSQPEIPGQQAAAPQEESVPAATQQSIEDRIKGIAVDTGGTEISYRGIEEQKDGPDRPAGSRMMTVSLNLNGFLTASSLYRDTGEVTSRIFREALTDPDVYDVIVWYYGDSTDQYGRKSNGIVLSQAIDKATFLRIAWDNFDESKLCDFLKAEGLRNGGETACVARVNFK